MSQKSKSQTVTLCGIASHQGCGERVSVCPQCSPRNFCKDPTHPRAKTGKPKTRNSCPQCSPGRWCHDLTHVRGIGGKVVLKQACYDCTPQRFCDKLGHPRGHRGRFRNKDACWVCHPQNFCLEHDHATPKRKHNCRSCNPKRRKVEVVVRRRRRKPKSKQLKVTDMMPVRKRKRKFVEPPPATKRSKLLDTSKFTYPKKRTIPHYWKTKLHSPGPSSTLAQLNLKPYANPLLAQSWASCSHEYTVSAPSSGLSNFTTNEFSHLYALGS